MTSPNSCRIIEAVSSITNRKLGQIVIAIENAPTAIKIDWRPANPIFDSSNATKLKPRNPEIPTAIQE